MSTQALSNPVCDAPVAPSARELANSRAADHMIEFLRCAGVELIFGLPGGSIGPLNDALLSVPDIRCITTAHENSAMFAAAGYARVSGKPGVVLVTSGPGILNAMTGLASALCENVPLLVLVGDVPRRLRGKNALQDGDRLGIRNALTAITRWTAEVPSAHAAVPMLARALEVATTGPRGPVALIVPADVQSTSTPVARVATTSPRVHTLPRAALEPVIDIIQNTERGVIFAGSGCRRESGPYHLRALAETLHWPVVTTPAAKGVFPECHPLSRGVFGMGGHPSAHALVDAGLDTILAVGTDLGDVATNGFDPHLRPPGSHVIHICADLAQVGRNYPVDIAIGAPADLFMEELYRALPLRAIPDATLHTGMTTDDHPESAYNGPEGRISPARAIFEIQKSLPADTVFTVDSGAHFFFATHYLRLSQPDVFLAMSGLGSMGSSISALGAKLAAPERPVAAICGDGGFRMIASELSTAVANHIPIAIFVLNDMRLGMVEQGNMHIFARTPDYSTGPLDISGLARALGARACVVERAGDLLAFDLSIWLEQGPVVVDIRIDRQVPMPVSRRFDTLGSAAAAHGTADERSRS